MTLVVTGLAQTGEISALRAALAAAGLPTDALQVVTPDEAGTSVARGVVRNELYTHEGGTGVPGLNNERGARSFFRDESLTERLRDLEIPDSEVDNYVLALERGRSVVAYFAHADTVERVETIFRGTDVATVRRF
ncbi:MAG: hypothetical protein NVS3B16_07950 [Vulcanimicrobiaceae bacterium]